MPKRSGDERERAPRRVPSRSLVLRFLREQVGRTPAELAVRAGIAEDTLLALETGRDELTEPRLERFADLLEVSPEVVTELVRIAEELQDGRPSPRWGGPILLGSGAVRAIRATSRRVGTLACETTRNHLVSRFLGESVERDRELARTLGVLLRREKDLIARVRLDAGFHLWSVAEWLCQESIDTMPRDRDRALLLARAAVEVAERAPGDVRFRWRLGGYCWAHVGNALRVRENFAAADLAFQRGEEYWQKGEGGDPGKLLDGSRILGMKASLYREVGRFAEALTLLRQALPNALWSEQPYLKINAGYLLILVGDLDGALRQLEEVALPLSGIPRLLSYSVRLNIGICLSKLGRLNEAEALLPELTRLTLELDSSVEQVRVQLFSAKIAAQRGRFDEARGRLGWITNEFLTLGRGCDAARAALALIELHFDRGEYATVKQLAKNLASSCLEAGIHHFAFEALGHFQQAAVAEALTPEYLARVSAYLEQVEMVRGVRFSVGR